MACHEEVELEFEELEELAVFVLDEVLLELDLLARASFR